MKKLLVLLSVTAMAVSCKKETTIEDYKVSYEMLRKSNPDAAILQDKLGYNTFWVIGDSSIEYIRFDGSDPNVIDEHYILNDIVTDQDYHPALNGSAYADPTVDNREVK